MREKDKRTSFSVRITDISTLNKWEEGDPKNKSQPFVQDCSLEIWAVKLQFLLIYQNMLSKSNGNNSFF